jgi:hypothetical protein
MVVIAIGKNGFFDLTLHLTLIKPMSFAEHRV